jgi:ADP-ribosylglycohydrolase
MNDSGFKASKDAFSGCLIGQCLGDALGLPVEGAYPGVCAKYVEQIMSRLRFGIAGSELLDLSPYRFGQYTDDSQLARELMQSYVAKDGFDPEDYAQRIAAIFREDRIVGAGGATYQAAMRLIEGVPWEEAGTAPPAAGNGSAMRAGPVGLICYDDSPSLLRIAHDQGRITHTDPRCSAGAAAIAGAVNLALRWPEIDPEAFLLKLAEWAGVFDEAFAGHLKQLIAWIGLGPDEAAARVALTGTDGKSSGGWQGISPFVVASVLWSLYSFLRSPDDYWVTVCTAIAVGGDVDSTAAMAGAISGARVGLEGVPQDLAEQLTDQGEWEYEQLVALAERCYAMKHGQS